MSTAASPIFGLIAAIAEQVSNATVDLDPNGRRLLNELDGRVIVIEIAMPDERVAIRIRDGLIRVSEHLERPSVQESPENEMGDQPNVWVRGQIPDLLRMLMSPDAPLTGLSIDGDETVLMELRRFVARWQPQWPMWSKTSKETQSAFNQPLFENLQSLAEFGVAAARSVASGATEAMSRRAASNFATTGDLDRFLDGVDELRLRVDRLAAKIDQQSRHSGG